MMIIRIVLCLTLVLTMINTIRICTIETIIETAIKLAKENIEKEERE